jgi:hypothetical protein
MLFLRKTMALIAWIVIYIPTTFFVVLVMVRNYLGERRTRREPRE